MSTKIQLRRGTAAQWTAANPVLAAGEVGYETDTGNIKVGTGTAVSGAWNSLPYYQLPRVSVVPATSSDLNAANYLVQGIYRLATNSTSGFTWIGTPSDFHSANTAESTLTVTIHQYTGQTTLTQQVLTQRTTASGSVKQWVRLWDGANFTAWTSTSHLSDNEVTTATIANATSTTDGVTNAKLRWSAAGSVIGRSAATAGAPADIVAGTDGHVLRRAADDTVGFGTLLPAAFDSNTDVPLSSLADQPALTVVANGGNTSAAPTAIAAANDGGVLRRSGNAVGFGTLAATAFDSNTDIPLSALADQAAVSVVGNGSASSAAPTAITAGTDGHVLVRSNGTLAFGQIAAASIPTNTIPYNRLSNATQTTLLGATTAGAISALTVLQIRNLCGFQLIPLSWLSQDTVNITVPGDGASKWIGWVLRTEYNLNPGDGFVMRPIRSGADITGGQTNFPVDIDGGSGGTLNTGDFYRQGVSIWLRVV